MALNRDKFRKIVGGITSEPTASPAETSEELRPPIAQAQPEGVAGQGAAGDDAAPPSEAKITDQRRFAKRGRPKGTKDGDASGKGRKIKVSLFLSEVIVNDLYDWAHADRIHPGEMFERALKPFHDKETKRRNGGKE